MKAAALRRRADKAVERAHATTDRLEELQLLGVASRLYGEASVAYARESVIATKVAVVFASIAVLSGVVWLSLAMGWT